MLLCAITRPGGILFGMRDKYRMSVVSSRCSRLLLIVGSVVLRNIHRGYTDGDERSCLLLLLIAQI